MLRSGTLRTNFRELVILKEHVMQILFVISILSFIVLIGAVYAVVRHVRRSTAEEVVDPALTDQIAPPANPKSDTPSPLRRSA
jgi:hypothetical protein